MIAFAPVDQGTTADPALALRTSAIHRARQAAEDARQLAGEARSEGAVRARLEAASRLEERAEAIEAKGGRHAP